MSTDQRLEPEPTDFFAPRRTPKLNAALAKAQAEFKAVTKNKTADAGSYKYNYADLASVVGGAYPILGKNGLAFSACPTMSDGNFVLAYALLHESGEERSGELPLPSVDGRTSWQQMGIAISYARRYAFGAVTGIVTEEDTDGQGATPPERKQMPAAAQRGRERAQQRRGERGGETEEEAEKRLRGRMFSLFAEIGMDERDQQIMFIEDVLGRPLGSRREMTISDYNRVIPELETEKRKQQAEPVVDRNTGEVLPEGYGRPSHEVRPG